MTKSRAKERCTTCGESFHAGKNGTRPCPRCFGDKDRQTKTRKPK